MTQLPDLPLIASADIYQTLVAAGPQQAPGDRLRNTSMPRIRSSASQAVETVSGKGTPDWS